MKPKYRFFSNTKYALNGVFAMLKAEMSFRLECLFVCPLLFVAFLLEISLMERICLIGVLFLILIAERFNSAIESCVDLVTQEFHTKAKIAKDCASAGVFFAILTAVFTWGLVLINL